MASRASNSTSSSLSRYYPAVLALTCATAVYGIYYLRTSYASPSTGLSSSSSRVRRRNAVHRRRRLEVPPAPGHEFLSTAEFVATPTAMNAIRMLQQDEDNNVPWMGLIGISLDGGVEEVNLLPSQRQAEAQRVQESRGLPEQDRERLAFLIERGLLRRFFRNAFPSSYVIGQIAPGETAFVIQELTRIGLSRYNIEESIYEHNAVHDIRVADQNQPPLPADGATNTQPDNDEAENEDDEQSVHPWRGGTRESPNSKEPQGLLHLMYHIAEDQARRDGYVHRGVTCNSCGMMPILGIRYRCSNCVDFDLCENCETQGFHNKTHVFYKVRLPAPFLGNPRHTQQVWYPGKPNSLPRTLPRSLAKRIMKETSFETPEMDALWEQFKCLASVPWLDDPNGINMAIDRKSFDKCFVPNTSVGCPQENLIYDRMFRFYDTNNDRLIGYEEFIKGLACLNNKNKDEKMKRVFQGYDSDEDGFVSRIDFLRMFRAFYVLTKELTRDMVAGMEDEYGDNQSVDAVTGSQAISGTFNGPDIRDSTVPSNPKIAKRFVAENGMDIDEGPLEESKEDIADRNTVIGDAAERAEERAQSRRLHPGSEDSYMMQDASMDVYEAMGARHPAEEREARMTEEQSATNSYHQIPLAGLHQRPGLSEGARQVLQNLENHDRPEEMAQLVRADPADLTEALRVVEHEIMSDVHNEESDRIYSRPSSPEILRRTAMGLREQIGDETAFDRIIRATSPEIRNMLADGPDPNPHERSSNAAAEELGRVLQVDGEASDPPEQSSQSGQPGSQDPQTSGSGLNSDQASSTDSTLSMATWPPIFASGEDVIAALGRDVPVEDVTDQTERKAVNDTVSRRLASEDIQRIGEIRKRSVSDRWRRRQFYVDVEEGSTAPPDFVDNDIPAFQDSEAAETPSTASDSHPPSPRSRSSSKVRFQDEYLTDTDYDTRSNHSNSSRSIPIGERWGGYRLRDSEKDVGKEILYQASQQGLNELLDALFKPKEDMYIEAENAAPERRRLKEELDKLEAEQGQSTATLNSQILESLETGGKTRFVGSEQDMGNQDARAFMPDSPSSPDFLSHPPPGNTHPTSSQILQSLIRNASRPPHLSSLPNNTNDEWTYEDPTLPQFRPNTTPPPSPPAQKPHQPESELTSPSPAQLQRYLLHRKVEREAKERRGGGRLDFKEFEEVMHGERGRKLAFVGAWIEMASFWSP
jgi:hypothetical protein